MTLFHQFTQAVDLDVDKIDKRIEICDTGAGIICQ